jgi:peptide deformylase
MEVKELVLSPKEDVENVFCEDVTAEEALEMIKLGEKMIEACAKWGGIGLAAPQIGIKKKMFIWTVGEDLNGRNFQIVFNPKYFVIGKKQMMLEGCLSYASDHFLIERYKRINVYYYTFYNGKFMKVVKPLLGLKAVIFQHECDHINGQTIALKGERLDEEKNKSFIDSLKGDIPSEEKQPAKEGAGTGGSASYSFEPNPKPPEFGEGHHGEGHGKQSDIQGSGEYSFEPNLEPVNEQQEKR